MESSGASLPTRKTAADKKDTALVAARGKVVTFEMDSFSKSFPLARTVRLNSSSDTFIMQCLLHRKMESSGASLSTRKTVADKKDTASVAARGKVVTFEIEKGCTDLIKAPAVAAAASVAVAASVAASYAASLASSHARATRSKFAVAASVAASVAAAVAGAASVAVAAASAAAVAVAVAEKEVAVAVSILPAGLIPIELGSFSDTEEFLDTFENMFPLEVEGVAALIDIGTAGAPSVPASPRQHQEVFEDLRADALVSLPDKEGEGVAALIGAGAPSVPASPRQHQEVSEDLRGDALVSLPDKEGEGFAAIIGAGAPSVPASRRQHQEVFEDLHGDALVSLPKKKRGSSVRSKSKRRPGRPLGSGSVYSAMLDTFKGAAILAQTTIGVQQNVSSSLSVSSGIQSRKSVEEQEFDEKNPAYTPEEEVNQNTKPPKKKRRRIQVLASSVTSVNPASTGLATMLSASTALSSSSVFGGSSTGLSATSANPIDLTSTGLSRSSRWRSSVSSPDDPGCGSTVSSPPLKRRVLIEI